MKIVAISGWKNSGKDTVADFLVRTRNFKKLSFAHMLKDMASEQYSIPRAHFDDRDHKEAPILNMRAQAKDDWSRQIIQMVFGHLRSQDGLKPSSVIFENNQVYGVFNHFGAQHHYPIYHTPRSVLVIEGSTKRSISPNYWVKAALDKTVEGGLYVISDVRFRSEIQDLKELAGSNLVTLRMERHEQSDQNDPSERDLDNYNFDFVINNKESEGKTLREVYESVIEALIDSRVLNENLMTAYTEPRF